MNHSLALNLTEEDAHLARESNRPKEELYRNLRAACESGWDFSSRWLDKSMELTSIQTTRIVPVDLNGLLYYYERALQKGYELNGDSRKTQEYSQLAEQRKKAILAYCWSESEKRFGDYQIDDKLITNVPSAAMMYPLFLGIATDRQARLTARFVKKHLLSDGGVVTTPFNTGQQWDSPNGWAPLQWVAYKGFTDYGHDNLANEIATRWLALNERTFRKTGRMMEKYNVKDQDAPAGGGEYSLQDGFGWTNGVYLKLLQQTTKQD